MASLRADAPPMLPVELVALWWAKRDAWDRAHDLLQDLTTVASSRVHAYLHRVEGDLANAGYWYRRAGVAVATDSLDDEWAQLAGELLAQASADSALR
ncbi:MAG TPA: hypothetical protein VMJ74_13300 [Pseudomonadales bacterium]|nr:hypothetical protein [Pseudomonadales bacterium]